MRTRTPPAPRPDFVNLLANGDIPGAQARRIERIAAAVRLREKGYTIEQTADIMSMSERTVYRLLADA